jgi:hypothetical protein
MSDDGKEDTGTALPSRAVADLIGSLLAIVVGVRRG